MRGDLPSPRSFVEAWPFPHAVVDGLWNASLLDDLVDEVPPAHDPRWRRFQNELEVKLEGGPAMWGPAAAQVAETLASPAFIGRLERLTGIEGLLCRFEGGGYHRIEPPSGKLGVHTDFNATTLTDGTLLWRRLNLLVYLNRGWEVEWGGELELWPERDGVATRMGSVDVLPEFNRTVIFETSDHSWHGHPSPLVGPRPRLSFAAYYFTVDRPAHASAPHDTIFTEA